MSFIYHLVSNGSAHCRYVRISGTAAAPVVEAEVVLIPTSVTNITYGLWSPDGGATLWVIGEDNFATPDLSLVVVRSTDGGATWTNRQAALPPITGRHTVRAIGGFAGDQSVVLGIETPFGNDNFSKLNLGTDNFDIAQGLGGSHRPNSVWAVEGTDTVYGTVATVATNLWRSLDRGASWGADATYLTGMTGRPWHVVTDPRDGRIYTLGYTSFSVCRHGVWGGPWVNDPVFPASTQIDTPEGRTLGCDETGAVWAFLTNSSLGHQVYRKDPGTGIWSLSLQGATGNRGGLWVIDSQNILCSIANYLHFWDGAIWHSYHCTIDLGLTDQMYRGIWGTGGPKPPARVQLPGGYLDLFSSNAPAARIALINCIPEDTETGVKVGALLRGTVVSLDNLALAATTKLYVSINGAAEVLAYDQAGGGFQAGWDGALSSVTIQASPGSGVNDELVYVIHRTTAFPSQTIVTVRAEAETV